MHDPRFTLKQPARRRWLPLFWQVIVFVTLLAAVFLFCLFYNQDLLALPFWILGELSSSSPTLILLVHAAVVMLARPLLVSELVITGFLWLLLDPEGPSDADFPRD
jgi:lysylphosphatidylglycerol synthetase-like protein (DUF2156 family)